MRPQFIDELIARLDRYHLIRVNGTPASGKTSMTRVLANELLARYPQTPVYLLCGWEWDDVRFAGGWALYLQQQLGTHGHRLITHPGFLLLDEAQQTYWDTQLWTDLFKSITGSSAVKVVLFTCYGSAGSEPGWATTTMRELPGKTPMVFKPHQQISLRPEESEETAPRWKPVGLLLDETEAHEILDRYVPIVISNGADILTKELKHGLFLVSGGHAGLLVSLADALELIPEIYALIRKRQPLDWTTQSAYSSFFKNAVMYDGTLESSYAGSPDQQRALQAIWKEGWLHAEIVLGETRYVFPTQIHRWLAKSIGSRYCQCLFFRDDAPAKEMAYRSPLEMATEAIRQFDPHQLSKTARTLEDQYQKEFYRCLFPLLLEYQIAMLPEYLIKKTAGLRSGRIDFLVEQKKWGLELMCDGDRITQYMRRFEKDGPYFAMIRDELMEDYIVLNFTQTRPRRKYPGYRGHLYHVVFSEDCRNVQVLDASDLSEVVAFVLVEKADLFR
ncbi:uncharacterized protein BO66DRAFT_406762 [Aspergillus aculeatinus CBS 121060]|uniref:Uncharacterized protein n=1 Tax=Aspergillus aculeatinus CBS 121060 TaxID=1448322 RepID=A0ACD1GRL4_9EURO|nr:hypothetical protein BO66DRAFT_406762 [Aspergillus aculeatinus CBS 121060]RAH63999.1 hypothetical protein BO66DRAFT_406762 [Aspergillus aculeatinus CBS 121060]